MVGNRPCKYQAEPKLHLQAERDSLVEHGTQLTEEKAQLKGALALALDQKAALEASLQALRQELDAQRAQVSPLACAPNMPAGMLRTADG